MSHTHRNACLLLLLSITALAGCSSFQEDFTVTAAVPVPAGSIEGAWVGAWRSADNEHFGELKAIVSRLSDTEYQVRYYALYKWLFFESPYEMTVRLHGEHSGGTFHFEGSEDLGLFYGMYHYAGYATDTQFFSTYQTGNQKGEYQMRRVSENVGPPPE